MRESSKEKKMKRPNERKIQGNDQYVIRMHAPVRMASLLLLDQELWKSRKVVIIEVCTHLKVVTCEVTLIPRQNQSGRLNLLKAKSMSGYGSLQ